MVTPLLLWAACSEVIWGSFTSLLGGFSWHPPEREGSSYVATWKVAGEGLVEPSSAESTL